ncbi:FAD-binding oxidoreductase [Hoyosella sp. G463]|uniref:Delta(24)-sterol reductase n=1 Tax=Lolliginicoccus lacisalsi TaxID=2742202 RepID=A0A927JEM2_9ACTN|nr:FAD-binding oxidoreductase [Lolliginicoccus lacisalsi]
MTAWLPGDRSSHAGRRAYEAVVERLVASYRSLPEDAPVRLAKKTSNLFRHRARTGAPGLDVSGLGGVISIDPEARTADVGGMCTYEDLVDATLAHGLMPLVVPQLKTITLGGAVTGLGIESSSFRNGLPHESVLEMDILTGAGEVLTAAPTGPHADLFHGFPNSYGTLGYATRLRITLEPVEPFVELRHVRFPELDSLQDAIADISEHHTFQGELVDFLDGVMFSATESYLVLGRWTSEPGPVSDYTGAGIFYRSIQHDQIDTPAVDRLRARDYLWRWDTDWFWCSRAFGAQHPVLRRAWPGRWRRSSVYWKLLALDNKIGLSDRLDARRGEAPRERVVQDIEVPVEHTADFLRWFLSHVPIEPVWLCPLRLRGSSAEGTGPQVDHPWPLYPLHRDRTYVNIGFWSAVPTNPANEQGHANRMIEAEVSRLDGHKSLYSDSYYDRTEFEELYGGDSYRQLKQRYDPNTRLLDLYAKAVRNQ